jgi:hypothetical protein
MKKILNILLRPLGLEVNTKGLKWERDALIGLYRDRLHSIPKSTSTTVECIIFSKDRPMQLHALLSSFYEKISCPIRVHVLYHLTTDSYKKAYIRLIELFLEKPVTFVEQRTNHSFKEDLLDILSGVESEKIFFLVDDIVIVEDLNIDDFASFDVDRFVPSLRLGKNISHFYHFNIDQPQPAFIYQEHSGKAKFFWQWSHGKYDWGYPLSLDGHLFSTDEIISMIRTIECKAPNSLENSLNQFKSIFEDRFGVCYKKSVVLNNPCNKVQSENENKYGDLDQGYLLRQWHKGYQIDYRKLYGFINHSPQQEVEIQLITRTTVSGKH